MEQQRSILPNPVVFLIGGIIPLIHVDVVYAVSGFASADITFTAIR